MTTRHLYNNTAEAWQITFVGGSLPDLPGASENQQANWVGTIPANSSCSLTFGQNSGQLLLSSAKGTQWSYSFSTNSFYTDPKWNHNGDTPGAVLNDPSDGDFQIVEDLPQGWASAAAQGT